MKVNSKSISKEMEKVDLENNLNGLVVNEANSRFLSVYEKIWNEYFPLKRISLSVFKTHKVNEGG